MFKYCVILILQIVIGLYCLYGTAFYAWVTATPVSPEGLHRAQMLFWVWLGGFVLAFALFVGTVVRMAYLPEKGKR
jgi:hypothetical protein